MPGVVHDHIQLAALGEGPVDRGVGGVLGGDVQLDGVYVDPVAGAVPHQAGRCGRVAGRDLADARVHGVTGEGQSTHGQCPMPLEAPVTRMTFPVSSFLTTGPFVDRHGWLRAVQMIPPLARMTCPLIQ